MFKNITAFRIVQPGNGAFDDLQAFVPCASNQQKSAGWVPPREENGPLVEFTAGQHIMKLMIETKAVPAEVLARKVDEVVADIEVKTGRKPGKKERREIKEDALLSLLPMAFSKRAAIHVWIDQTNKLLVVDSATQARVDEVVTMLIKAFDGLVLQMVNTITSPAVAMAYWLFNKESPEHFSVDRECELKAMDKSKAVVKYGRHALDIDEVVEHIRHGKVPTKLAMTWNDRVSFVLTDAMTIKRIELLDTVMSDKTGEDVDQFDADVALATGELSVMLADLIGALGGEAAAQE